MEKQINNIISSIKQLGDGRLLFGTDRGLLEYDGKSFKKLTTDTVKAFLIDSKKSKFRI